MNVSHEAFKGASWLALFKLVSQAFSWAITIIIARLLIPSDYGIFGMALFITGYAELFSELGLGSALIQKHDLNKRELSSIFWFSLFVSILFALSCFPIAYLTAQIFNNTKIIPLTESASIIFLLSGLQTVPIAMLKKELEFKKVGWIEMVSTCVSSIVMLLIAYLGGGFWALLGGRIIRSFLNTIFLFSITKWYPVLHFNLMEVKSYLRFGITISIGRSLFYICEMSDKFFVGRVLGANMLGLYSFAMQLSMIPIEKIVPLINQVSYPAFAKLQKEPALFNNFYLDIVKVTGTLVMPVFIGGFLLGEDLIKILLDEKWYPIIFIFRYLCLAQILISLITVNSFVHNAIGKPERSLYFNLAGAVLMPISFYYAVQFGLNAILVPWFTTHLIIDIIWVIFTLRTMRLTIYQYILNLLNPVLGVIIMVVVIKICEHVSASMIPKENGMIISVAMRIAVGAISYIVYLWFFDRGLFYNVRKLKSA